MAKPRVVTDLEIWRIERGLTDGQLADLITEKCPEKPITERQVGRWRKGLVVPRYPAHLAALAELSGGRVTADSFIRAKMKEPSADDRPGES